MVMRRGTKAVRYTATVGMMAASIECAKLALAAIPNVEAVSLLIALYSYVFGAPGVIAAAVFVCIEPLVWGMGSWVLSYLIYWPTLALIFLFIGKAKIKNRFILSGTVLILTFFFGILTSFVDVGLFSGSFDRLFYRFGVYYARGIVFYLTQMISNLIIFLFLFPILSRALRNIKSRAFNN